MAARHHHGSARSQEKSLPLVIEDRSRKGEVRRWSRGKILGKGGFASCYEIRDMATNQLCAGKVVRKSSINKSKSKQKQLYAEIAIHRSLSQGGKGHPHVLKFLEWFEDDDNVYMVLEICPNRTMMDLVKRRKRLTEPETQYYMDQLLAGMMYMHKENVIHRDLKLGNIFLDEKMGLKIGDYGLAAKIEYDGERKKTICGTPNYIAPEILSGRHGHSFEVDTWAAGVIMYTLLIGKPPFETTDVKLTYRKIKANSYSFPDHVPTSRAARDLITRILHPNPDCRPTLAQIRSHEFFSKGTIPTSLPLSALTVAPKFSSSGSSKSSARGSSTQPLRTLDSNRQTATTARTKATTASAPLSSRDKYSTAPIRSAAPARASAPDVPKITPRETPRTQTDDKDEAEILQKAHQELIHSFARMPTSTAPASKISTATTEPGLTNMLDKMTLGSSTQPSTARTARADNGLQVQAHSSAAAAGRNTNSATAPDVWVSKWVDYSSKYGLGYLLCDGHIGVVFNDSTKIVLHPDASRVEYVERRKVGGGSYDDKRSFQLASHPAELTKKVTLLKHFKNYLLEHTPPGQEAPSAAGAGATSMIYVKKWLRTRHAFIFRLSNKTIQVHFHDHTEIILSSEARVVTYMDKKRHRATYPLVNIPSQPDLVKRLKYTKEILYQLIVRSGDSDDKKAVAADKGK